MVAQEIRKFYFGDAKIDVHTFGQYIDMLNDIGFYYPILKSIVRHSKETSGNTFYIQLVLILFVCIYYYFFRNIICGIFFVSFTIPL